MPSMSLYFCSSVFRLNMIYFEVYSQTVQRIFSYSIAARYEYSDFKKKSQGCENARPKSH